MKRPETQRVRGNLINEEKGLTSGSEIWVMREGDRWARTFARKRANGPSRREGDRRMSVFESRRLQSEGTWTKADA